MNPHHLPFLTFHLILFPAIFQLGDEIEVRPGIVSKDSEGRIKCKPIYSRIVTLFAENNHLEFAVTGGLIGRFFPSYCLHEIF